MDQAVEVAALRVECAVIRRGTGLNLVSHGNGCLKPMANS